MIIPQNLNKQEIDLNKIDEIFMNLEKKLNNGNIKSLDSQIDGCIENYKEIQLAFITFFKEIILKLEKIEVEEDFTPLIDITNQDFDIYSAKKLYEKLKKIINKILKKKEKEKILLVVTKKLKELINLENKFDLINNLEEKCLMLEAYKKDINEIISLICKIDNESGDSSTNNIFIVKLNCLEINLENWIIKNYFDYPLKLAENLNHDDIFLEIKTKIINFYYSEILKQKNWINNLEEIKESKKLISKLDEKIYLDKIEKIFKNYFENETQNLLLEENPDLKYMENLIIALESLKYNLLASNLKESQEFIKNEKSFSEILKLKNMIFLYLGDKITIYEFEDYIIDDCPNSKNILLILKENEKTENLKEYYIFHYYRLILHIFEIFWEDILMKNSENKKSFLNILRHIFDSLMSFDNLYCLRELIIRLSNLEFSMIKSFGHIE